MSSHTAKSPKNEANITPLTLSGRSKKSFDFCNPIRNLFYSKTKDLVDFTIKLKDGTFIPCHKLVLYSRCPFFKTLFSSKFEDSNSEEIALDFFDSEIIEDLVRFIYLGNIDIKWNNMEKYVQAISYLGVEDLLECCDQYIRWHITADNAAKWFGISLGTKIPHTHQMIISKYFDVISKTMDFVGLSVGRLKGIIKSEDIECHEDVILKACLRWLEGKGNNSKDPHRSVLSCIRYQFCSSKYLNSLPMFVKAFVPLEFLDEQWLTETDTEPKNGTASVATEKNTKEETQETDDSNNFYVEEQSLRQSDIRDYISVKNKGKRQADIREFFRAPPCKKLNDGSQISMSAINNRETKPDTNIDQMKLDSIPKSRSIVDPIMAKQPRNHHKLRNVVMFDYRRLGDKDENFVARDDENGLWYGDIEIPDKVQEGTICTTSRGIIISGGRWHKDTYDRDGLCEEKGYITDQCRLFDTTQHKWFKIPSMLDDGRRDHKCVMVGDSMYVLGGKKPTWTSWMKGKSAKKVSCLELNQMNWVEKAHMLVKMEILACCEGLDKFIFVFGKYKENNVFHMYNTKKNKWFALAPPPGDHFDSPSMIFINHHVYFACCKGENFLYVHLYDMKAKEWQRNVKVVRYNLFRFVKVETSVLYGKLACMAYCASSPMYGEYERHKLKLFNTETLEWESKEDGVTGWIEDERGDRQSQHDMRGLFHASIDVTKLSRVSFSSNASDDED